jgi:hypothetical protein
MKRKGQRSLRANQPAAFKETGLFYSVAPNSKPAAMRRTQIYLNKSEYDFVQAEAGRRDEPMAAVIRSFIDEKMAVPDEMWEKNPLLEPTPEVPGFGHEDGGINHDHYIYGSPKKYRKKGGRWVYDPPKEP